MAGNPLLVGALVALAYSRIGGPKVRLGQLGPLVRPCDGSLVTLRAAAAALGERAPSAAAFNAANWPTSRQQHGSRECKINSQSAAPARPNSNSTLPFRRPPADTRQQQLRLQPPTWDKPRRPEQRAATTSNVDKQKNIRCALVYVTHANQAPIGNGLTELHTHAPGAIK